LKGLGIKHVYNSRDFQYVEQINQDTDGKGVDVVLNYATGKYIEETLKVTAKNGRFIEIGKLDIYSPEQMKQTRPDIEYHTVAIDEIIKNNPGYIQKMLREVTKLFEENKINPLPQTIFAFEESVEAFKFLQNAKQIGKVALVNNQRRDSFSKDLPIIHADKSYLITGGLGGIGFKLVEYLIEQGARTLILTGRNKPSQIQEKIIRKWKLECQNLNIYILQGDVSQKKDVDTIFSKIDREMPPLAGVFHVAGVLSDDSLENQTWKNFEKVFAPKVQGAKFLHEWTRNKNLDHFVMFSSISAIMGTPGQSNYAAANAYMDALSHHRNSIGLPAKSINWGPWEEVGMAAKSNQDYALWGLKSLEVEEGFNRLMEVLALPMAQTCVSKIDWQKFANFLSSKTPFYSKVFDATNEKISINELFIELDEVTEEERKEVLKKGVKRCLSKVLGFSDIHSIDEFKNFQTFGMDSLMGIQLHLLLAQNLSGRCQLESTALFEYPNVAELSKYLEKICFGKVHLSNESKTSQIEQNSWLKVLKHVPSPRFKLFCFPHVGSDPSSYVKWPKILSDDVELIVIHLPGHVGRIHEPLLTSVSDIVVEVMKALDNNLENNIPFVFFGHSLGSIIAYEVCQELQKNRKPLPKSVFVSSLDAPQIITEKQQCRKMHEIVEEYVNHMFDSLSNKGKKVSEIYMSIIRNDFEVLRSYKFEHNEKLNCPINAVGGTSDPIYSLNGLKAWETQTKRKFHFQQLSGDHFYVMNKPEKLVNYILEKTNSIGAVVHGGN